MFKHVAGVHWPNVGPTYRFQLDIDPTANNRMLTLGQCWANVVLSTPTIGQPYYPMPTFAQHSHAIWVDASLVKGGGGLNCRTIDEFACNIARQLLYGRDTNSEVKRYVAI